MEGKNNLVVIISVVAILFFVANFIQTPRSQSVDNLQYDLTSQTFSRGERIQYPYPDWGTNRSQYDIYDVTGDGIYSLADYVIYIYGPYADYGEYGNTGYPKSNACGYENYGYPSYIGTQKEGQTCADALSDQNDMECLNSAPYNYDGLINKLDQTSDPLISCCVSDGTCNWNK